MSVKRATRLKAAPPAVEPAPAAPKQERRSTFRRGDEVTMPSGRPGRVVAVEGDCVTVRYTDTRKSVEEVFISPRYLARWQ